MDTQPLPQALFALHESSESWVFVFDAEDRLRYANPAYRAAVRLPPQECLTWAGIMRANHAHRQGLVIETDDIELWLATVASRRGKQPYRCFEVDTHDGRWFWVSETLSPEGWLLCIGTEITALRQDVRSLRQARDKALRAARTDSMTGLANRGHALTQLRQALDNPDAAPLCVALLDLDHFKRINDSLGHAAGDAVITDFCRHMLACTRREDMCARLGGEEFLLMLPHADLAQASAVVQRLLERTRQARPLPGLPDQGYTASAGVALARAGDSTDSLLHRADAALYQAKAGGRDRLVQG